MSNKNKLIRKIDPITWNQLKVMATEREITIAEMIKIVVDFFNEQKKGEL